MTTLLAADSIEIQVIVDNVTDSLSSMPSFVETEFQGLSRRRQNKWMISGACLCCAAHGLSCLVTLKSGDKTRTFLFDSGPEDRVFAQNASRLGLDLASVEAIVLSHGHWDHAGAMLRALQMIRDGNGGKTVPFFAHPDMFRTRGVKFGDAALRVMEDVSDIDTLTTYGAEVVNTKEPVFMLNGLAYISGEIPRLTAFEKGFPGQHWKTPQGEWELDEMLWDERYVAVNVAGKGLVVFTACSHAGVVNVLKDAQKTFPNVPLHAVIGGFHLSGANEKIIPETVAALKELNPAVIAAGHCTGWRAMNALANAFDDSRLAPMAVGKRYNF
jgi:7,8-dihydropterin-6-yl-methyl-4-(beta-D-ribofuranosyl)aminobenzene 5'-phosphate synthase